MDVTVLKRSQRRMTLAWDSRQCSRHADRYEHRIGLHATQDIGQRQHALPNVIKCSPLTREFAVLEYSSRLFLDGG